ncbi:MAG: polysaccharide biosynthesis protein [Candidatus Krumholzibacteriia bacterium]
MSWRRMRQRIFLLVLDLMAVTAAYGSAYVLRFDGEVPVEYLHGMLRSLPLLMLCFVCGFTFMGVYRVRMEFAGATEVFRIAKGTAIGAIAFIQLLFLLHLDGVPRTVVPMGSALVFLLTSSLRLAPRFHREFLNRPKGGLRVLVLGAGRAGEMIVREMQRQVEPGYVPVGFIDDNPYKQDAEIHGIRVLGTQEDALEIVQRHRVEEIIIAAPSASGRQMRRMVETCQAARVPYRTVPGLREIMDGRVLVRSVREVCIEDLLGRHPTKIDSSEVRRFLAGKCVLVTGAAGSIGSELCRQIVGYRPAALCLLDQNENGLFYLGHELRALHADFPLETLVCDVTDSSCIQRVVASASPHVLFHAAAYKHVPLMEKNIREAVRNNVFGTLNVANAAERSGVHSLVFISTDKAVEPSSVMGATKRIAELIVQQHARRGAATQFTTVRFGNVLGSQGSVVTVFREQISRGGPVTVTSPDMKRFFMTIPEAVQLITQAATMGKGGEIFILDMGEPIAIEEMARHMIRLSGLDPDRDIEIQYTGMRDGEKLEERLWAIQEDPQQTVHPQILVSQSTPPGAESLQHGLETLAEAVARDNDALLLRALGMLAPDFSGKIEADSDNVTDDLLGGGAA